MTDLPPGWEWATLEDLAAPITRAITDGPFGSNLKSEHYTESGARVVRLQNIGDGRFRDELSYISLSRFEALRAHEAREGDLIVASLGVNPPRACLLPSFGCPAIVKADCIRIRLSSHVDSRWLLHTLTSPQTKKHAANLVKGVSRPRLGLAHIRALPVPVPPLAEQRRISSRLESLISQIEAGANLIDKVSENSAGLELSAGLRELSAVDHSAVRLSRLLREPLVNGRSVPTRVGGFPVLRLSALTSGNIQLAERKGGAWSREQALPFLVKAGDYLVSRGNGTLSLVGRGSAVSTDPGEVAFPDTMIRVRPDENLLTFPYLALLWNLPIVRRQIEQKARTTAGIYKINQSIVGEIQLPLPSCDDQRRIVEHVHTITSKIAAAVDDTSGALARARILHSRLLSDAFAGRLVLQDPNDEPASVLLARIRAEQVAQPRTRLGRRTPKKPDEQGSLL